MWKPQGRVIGKKWSNIILIEKYKVKNSKCTYSMSIKSYTYILNSFILFILKYTYFRKIVCLEKYILSDFHFFFTTFRVSGHLNTYFFMVLFFPNGFLYTFIIAMCILENVTIRFLTKIPFHPLNFGLFIFYL